MKITAVVVTFNRKLLLEKCILALLNQTRQPDLILVIDNASTDGTGEYISEILGTHSSLIKHIILPENIGGAGGFSHGIRSSVAMNSDWSWIMDDDAEPALDALEELLKTAKQSTNIYGSIAVNGNTPCWNTTLIESGVDRPVEFINEIPHESEVRFLPFLGLLIPSNLVLKIGLPDTGFFIAADDVEYCLRAQNSGAKIIVAGKSFIYHPKADGYCLNLIIKKLGCLRLAPWKRYYDTRNRILIAKKYYGINWITKTIPGSFLRLLGALIHEQNKAGQLFAFTSGLIDGVLGIKGKRHTWWRIKQ